MSALLEVRDVTRSFGGVRAVDAASFDVVAGSITALIGPNGAGKSSLFNIVTRLPPAGATGRSTSTVARFSAVPPHRIAQAGLVRTFQTPRALTKMSVLENVLLAAPHHAGEHLGRVFATPRTARAQERGGGAARRGGCWHSSGSTIRRTPTRARSPAASASCSTSRVS